MHRRTLHKRMQQRVITASMVTVAVLLFFLAVVENQQERRDESAAFEVRGSSDRISDVDDGYEQITKENNGEENKFFLDFTANRRFDRHSVLHDLRLPMATQATYVALAANFRRAFIDVHVTNDVGISDYRAQVVLFERHNDGWSRPRTLILCPRRSQNSPFDVSDDGNVVVAACKDEGVVRIQMCNTKNGSWYGLTIEGDRGMISRDGKTLVIEKTIGNRQETIIRSFRRQMEAWIEMADDFVVTDVVDEDFRRRALSGDGMTMTHTVLKRNASITVHEFRIYHLISGHWIQEASVELPAGGVVASLALSFSGAVCVVAVRFTLSAFGLVYTRITGKWSQIPDKLVPDDGTGAWSIDVNGAGNVVVFCGHSDYEIEGACWIFTAKKDKWVQQGTKYGPEKRTGDSSCDLQLQYGQSVSMLSDGTGFMVGISCGVASQDLPYGGGAEIRRQDKANRTIILS